MVMMPMYRPPKLDALTSLRFFAAAVIVVGHAHFIFGSLGFANIAPLEQGVSFFFVLSGFILAYNYPALGEAGEVKKFWLARFARVWPLHAVTLGLWIALIFEFDRERYFPGFEGLARLVSNMLLLQSWIPLPNWAISFNGVAWSLSVEFFFYALFPILIRYWRDYWHLMLMVQIGIVAGIIIACSWMGLPTVISQDSIGVLGLLYTNPMVRLVEFSAGIAVAFLVRAVVDRKVDLSTSQWFAIEIIVIGGCSIALVAAANLIGVRNVFGGAAAYYLTREGLWLMFAVLIGVFALSRGPIARMLSTRPMVFLGEISFALYLSHALIIHFIEPYSTQLRASGGLAYIGFWLGLLTLSTILFYGVEQPARLTILRIGLGERNSGSALLWLGAWSRPSSAISIVILAGICVSAVIFRPSTINQVNDEDVKKFLTTEGVFVVAVTTIFDDRYQLLGFRADKIEGNKVELSLLMRNEADFVANDFIALHLNDEKSVMFAAPGDQLVDKTSRITPAGTYWVQKFVTTLDNYNGSHSFGIAMYKNPVDLYGVNGGYSDWGGRRLILQKPSAGLGNKPAS
jgi:peptidoglycan/LPS O-acetylase OafA/YrhL